MILKNKVAGRVLAAVLTVSFAAGTVFAPGTAVSAAAAEAEQDSAALQEGTGEDAGSGGDTADEGQDTGKQEAGGDIQPAVLDGTDSDAKNTDDAAGADKADETAAEPEEGDDAGDSSAAAEDDLPESADIVSAGSADEEAAEAAETEGASRESEGDPAGKEAAGSADENSAGDGTAGQPAGGPQTEEAGSGAGAAGSETETAETGADGAEGIADEQEERRNGTQKDGTVTGTRVNGPEAIETEAAREKRAGAAAGNVTFELESLALDAPSSAIKSGRTLTLTMTMVYSGSSWSELTDEQKKITITSSRNKVAKITSSGTAAVSSTEAGSGGQTRTTITRTVTVKGVGEGTAVITAAAGGDTARYTVKVDPVPVALGSASGLYWNNTATLCWKAVKNAGKYKVIVTVRSGSAKYKKTVTVSGTECDLESRIVSVIKSHKSKFTGAACSVTATVRALSTDAAHYKNGKAVKSPTLRYLMTTYKEAVSRNGWYLIGGSWYYYVAGKRQKGWVTFLDKRYFLDESGKLLTEQWVGRRYVKSNGEMARDEWVDDYQYYVNKKGLKDTRVKFSTKNWVETGKGWRYKKSGGGYVKNTWKTINHRVYYFDKSGYMETGWITIKGNKYHLKATGDLASGLGARETGWVRVGSSSYWCDDKGVLAKDQWVDRNQYYVRSNGKRVDRLCYQNLRNVNTSNRLGYYVYSAASAPEQSIAGFDLAYQNGNRIMVVNLRFTKDNVPVCFHDDLVGYARNRNGREPAAKPSVSGLTLKQLSEYDFGIYRGALYKGTGVLTLEDMAKWLKEHKDADIYIEVKTDKMTGAQISSMAKILKKYKIKDRTSIVFDVIKGSDTRAKRVHKALPTVRIGFMTGSVNSRVYKQARKAQGSKNEVFLYCWGVKSSGSARTKLTAATVKKLRDADILYECGTFMDRTVLDSVLAYYGSGAAYAYNSGVETAGAVFKDELMQATCHGKGKWETVEKGKKYLQIDRTYAKNKWMKIGGKKYYFNGSGFMVTGWLSLGGKRYYLGTNGVMVTGKKTIDGKKYTFDKDGALEKS